MSAAEPNGLPRARLMASEARSGGQVSVVPLTLAGLVPRGLGASLGRDAPTLGTKRQQRAVNTSDIMVGSHDALK
jgi:hypothetical protein